MASSRPERAATPARPRARAIRRVGIVGKRGKPESAQIAAALATWLGARGVRVTVDDETALGALACGAAPTALTSLRAAEIPARSDLIVVLGGDGTLIRVAALVGARHVPILGVNLGSLGFLTEVTLEEMYGALDRVLAGEGIVEVRRKLQVTHLRAGRRLTRRDVLNDAVLNKAALARIADFDTTIDGRFVTTFKSDGVIISTPTGSTAYAMAAGGPIVYPALECMVVTPICPHTLTHRPIVVPSSGRVAVRLRSQSEVYLTLDGQEGEAMLPDDEVIVEPSRRVTRLVRSPQKHFFEILRTKLKWGER